MRLHQNVPCERNERPGFEGRRPGEAGTRHRCPRLARLIEWLRVLGPINHLHTHAPPGCTGAGSDPGRCRDGPAYCGKCRGPQRAGNGSRIGFRVKLCVNFSPRTTLVRGVVGRKLRESAMTVQRSSQTRGPVAGLILARGACPTDGWTGQGTGTAGPKTHDRTRPAPDTTTGGRSGDQRQPESGRVRPVRTSCDRRRARWLLGTTGRDALGPAGGEATLTRRRALR